MFNTKLKKENTKLINNFNFLIDVILLILHNKYEFIQDEIGSGDCNFKISKNKILKFNQFSQKFKGFEIYNIKKDISKFISFNKLISIIS